MKMHRQRLLMILIAVCGVFSGKTDAGEKRPLVLATTFPMYLIARGVAAGRDGLELELLTASDAGHSHNHALKPDEMRKLAEADSLVINGLGMESYLDAAMERIGGGADVFDCSKFVGGPLPSEDGGFNQHFFASPSAHAEIAEGMAERFAALDPEGADAYRANARRYAEEMRALVVGMKAAADALPNRRVVAPEGALEYLARDFGLEIVAFTMSHGHSHDGNESAARMAALLKTIREKDAAAVLVNEHAPAAGALLAEETGLPAVGLETAESGHDGEDVPPDFFASAMRDNLRALADAMGGK